MRKASRRNKPVQVKREPLTFRLTVEGQEMIVSYEPHYMPDFGHFDFRSPHKPPQQIPVSETGYLSHFVPMADVEAAASPQDFAREVVHDLLRERGFENTDLHGQLSLF